MQSESRKRIYFHQLFNLAVSKAKQINERIHQKKPTNLFAKKLRETMYA